MQFIGHGECHIEQRLPSGNLQLKNLSTNECFSITEDSLIAALFDGTIEILGDRQETTLAERRRAQRIGSELSLLDESVKREIKRRFAYISAIKTQSVTKFTADTLLPLIGQVHQVIKDCDVPSPITLYRWFKRYIESGEDLMVLAPAYNRRGNTNRRLAAGDVKKSAEIASIINDVIDEKYLSRERPTIASVYDLLEARLIAINDLRDECDRLPVPHRAAIYSIIRKLDPFTVMKSRYGERLAKLKYDPVKQGPRPTRPLERVEIDHTKVDLMIIDPVMHLPVGRPWVTAAIDKFSRIILGRYISFNPPSYLSVMNCLRHAITPKIYVKERYPNIINAWDAYGIPELLVVDNGPEFHSTHFEDACLQLGINIHYAPPKKGNYKGSIERWFGTQNRQLLHAQPGTSFSNVLDRADYDPKKNAVITLDAFEEMFHTYIVDVYHRQEHRGLRDVPARLWKVAIAEYPVTLPTHRNILDVLLGCVEQRTVSAKGVELHSLFYNDDALALIRRRLKRGDRVTIKYDPNDIATIYVADKETGIYIPVPAINQEYAQGLSLWQHEMIKAYARRIIKENVDVVALSRAKQRIQEIVEREWLAAKRTSTRQRLARFINHEGEKLVQQREQPTSQERLELIGANSVITMPRLGTSNTASSILDEGKTFGPMQRESEVRDVGATTDSDGSPPHTITHTDTQKVTKAKARSKRTKKQKHNQTDEPSLVHETVESTELDMTGWKADYDLPH
jgi:putative transposase